ncbi:MAG: type II secretion system protein [Myxococcota bacterium]|nr:type II secretion system protein [Myxococcota bacterium]
MTLLEILVVIAILGLVIAVLAYYVFPSDDRRCRLEAERLAAYMTGAAAEAVMRDGATRVVFEFTSQVAKREVTRQGASLTTNLWDEDKKAKVFRVESPIRLDTVDTPAVPKLTSGTGYVIFRGSRTEGAVVTLALNETAYSVLVPPNDGEIRIEKGRPAIPGAKTFERPTLPDMTGYANKPMTGSAFPGAGVPKSMPITRRPSTTSSRGKKKPARRANQRRTRPRNTPKKRAPKTLPPRNPSNTTGEPPTFNPPAPPPPPKPANPAPATEAAQPPEPTEPAPEPTTPANPVTPSATPSNAVVNANLSATATRNYLIQAVSFSEPPELTGILTTMYNNLSTEGQLMVIVRLEENFSWLLQGQQAGTRTNSAGAEEAVYAVSEELPSYRMSNVLVDGDEADGEETTSEVQTCNATNTECVRTLKPEQSDAMVLYLRDNRVESTSFECKYFPLRLSNVNVQTTEDISEVGLGVDRGKVVVSVTAMVRPSDARAVQISDTENLLDALEDKGVQRNADTTDDGDLDGWKFEFKSTKSIGIVFDGDPAQRDQPPQSCEGLLSDP